jgi:hypothetical protein
MVIDKEQIAKTKANLGANILGIPSRPGEPLVQSQIAISVKPNYDIRQSRYGGSFLSAAGIASSAGHAEF